MTWMHAPDLTPPEPIVHTPRVRTRLASGDRAQCLATLLEVADHDHDPDRTRRAIIEAANLARRNPNLAALEIDLTREASLGHRSDIASLIRWARRIVPHLEGRPVEQARSKPAAKKHLVRVPKGARTTRAARRARPPHQGSMTMTKNSAETSWAELNAAMHWRGPGSVEAVVEKLTDHQAQHGTDGTDQAEKEPA